MSEDIRKMIDKVNSFKQFAKENVNDNKGSFKKVEPLINQPQTVKGLREKELIEIGKLQNSEQFLTNGKVDKGKIMASDNTEAKEIYNRYDKKITPLLNKNNNIN